MYLSTQPPLRSTPRTQPIQTKQLLRALALPDLTDSAHGSHCMQTLVQEAATGLSEAWNLQLLVHRSSAIVSTADNYDALRYPLDGAARDRRYTRYVNNEMLLRTHMSATIPALLRSLPNDVTDLLCLCPGLVYRRDVIDRLHVGEPHQLDLWRIRNQPTAREDLLEMIRLVVETLLPGSPWRVRETEHPYTLRGLEIEVKNGESWVEIGECGLAHPQVLSECGLPDFSGLAMGLGLDRLVMLRKGIDDIRLLRSEDPRVQEQMRDLTPYRPVSSLPPLRRDLSVSLPAGLSEEEVGDRVRSALGEKVSWVEEVKIDSRSSYESLPPHVRERLGMQREQENLLLRLVLRHPTQALTRREGNALANHVYQLLHHGEVGYWARDED